MPFQVFGYSNSQWRSAPGVSSFLEFVLVKGELWELPDELTFTPSFDETWEFPAPPNFTSSFSELWET